jgi:type IV pilus assembly protein PilN
MIKVNLLATSPGAAPAREWLPREQRSAAMGLMMLLVTAVGVGGYWWYLGRDRASVETRITAAEAEIVRLQDVAKLVERVTLKKTELTERLGLIERLRGSKRGPVRLLETVSVSLPDGLWLVEIKQKAMVVDVEGRALSLTSITDFAERMQNSGLFLRPVEILSTSTDVIEETSVIKFTVRAEAVGPAPAPATSPAITTAAPARPGA